MRSVVVEKVHRHGYSTTDQRGRPGGSGPIIAKLKIAPPLLSLKVTHGRF